MSNNYSKVKYVDVLEQRREYLRSRLAEVPDDHSGYIKQEIAALDWALPILTEALFAKEAKQ